MRIKVDVLSDYSPTGYTDPIDVALDPEEKLLPYLAKSSINDGFLDYETHYDPVAIDG